MSASLSSILLGALLLAMPPDLAADGPPDEHPAAAQPAFPPAFEACVRGDLQRTGSFPAGGIAAAPSVRWKFTAEGRYLSSPVVAGNMLVLGDEQNLYALDRSTGRLRWKYHLSGAGPSLIAGGTVFLGAGQNTLYAVDAQTGGPRWKILPGSERPTSPVLFGGMIIFGGGVSGNPPSDLGFVMAVEAATGKERWKFKIPYRITTPPAIMDGVVYIGYGNSGHVICGGKIYAIDAATGAEKWETPHLLSVSGSPVVSGDAVYFGVSGNGSGALMVVSRWTGQHLWKFLTYGTVHTPAIANGVVYFGTSEDQAGSFFAVDVATQKALWQYSGRYWVDSAPAVAGNTVYVADNLGVLRAFDAKTGRERWQFKAESGHSSASTLPVGRTVYFAAGNILYALE